MTFNFGDVQSVPGVSPPHFALPFRVETSSIAQVAQDSEDDINYCVECVVRYHPGERTMLPQFGIRDLAFHVQPLDGADLIAQIALQEPRAQTYVSSDPNKYDALWEMVTLGVAVQDQTEGAS